MKNIAALLDEAEAGIKRNDANLENLNRSVAIQMLDCVGRDYDNAQYLPTDAAINTFAPILNALGQVDLLGDYEKELVYQTVCEFLAGRGGLRLSRNHPDPEEGDNFYSDKDLLVQITTDGESLDFSETAGNNYSIKLNSIASIEYERNEAPFNPAYGVLVIKNHDDSCMFRFCTMSEQAATAIARLTKKPLDKLVN